MSIEWEFNLGFGRLRAEMEGAIILAAGKAMEIVRAEVTPLVPVETGNLAGSGDVTVVGHTAELLYPGPYARYQEFGVYYRHGKFGAPLLHTHGQSFFLLTGVHLGAPAAMESLRRDLFDVF
jgi:Bacteriophage protein of unknown function (DUF646).